MREWIEFHRLMGVERFFLYDHDSVDDHRRQLAPYIEAGVVTLYDWPIDPGQVQAANHCLEHHRDESRWIAFLDLDEFLFSPTGRPLPEVLADYEQWPGVVVNWATFGTSGHPQPATGPGDPELSPAHRQPRHQRQQEEHRRPLARRSQPRWHLRLQRGLPGRREHAACRRARFGERLLRAPSHQPLPHEVEARVRAQGCEAAGRSQRRQGHQPPAARQDHQRHERGA